MKKRTMAKIATVLVIAALIVVLFAGFSKVYAGTKPATFAGPEAATTNTITVETQATEEATVPTTEATEATQTTEPEETVPATTVPATTEPEETKPVETKPVETKPVETKPTVSVTEPTVPETTEPETEPSVPAETEPVEEPTVPEETEPVETTPVHEHNYTKTVVAATCTTEGFTVNVCECGHSFHSDATEKVAHNYVKQVVSATTEAEGYTLHVCEDCGDSYKSDITPMIVEVVEEEVPNCCPCTEGHNHKEIKRGPYVVIYCEGITEAYQDGQTIWMPWSKHQ